MDLKIKNIFMITIFQFSLLGLVLLSILMVIAVPVSLTSPQSWNENKNFIFTGSAAWAGLVFLVGVLNYLVV
jgi:photosystem II PsbZ protein